MSTTVNGNGKITDVSTELNLSQTNYDLYASLIQMSSPGMDLKTYFVQNYSKSYGGPGTVVDYSERKSNGYVHITLDARGSDVQPLEGSNVSVTKDRQSLGVQVPHDRGCELLSVPMDTSSYPDTMANMVTMDFYLTMPGKIVDSNAHKVNGNKAEWHYNMTTMNNAGTLYAKSDVAKSPGFESVASLLALVGCVYLLALRKKE